MSIKTLSQRRQKEAHSYPIHSPARARSLAKAAHAVTSALSFSDLRLLRPRACSFFSAREQASLGPLPPVHLLRRLPFRSQLRQREQATSESMSAPWVTSPLCTLSRCDRESTGSY